MRSRGRQSPRSTAKGQRPRARRRASQGSPVTPAGKGEAEAESGGDITPQPGPVVGAQPGQDRKSSARERSPATTASPILSSPLSVASLVPTVYLTRPIANMGSSSLTTDKQEVIPAGRVFEGVGTPLQQCRQSCSHSSVAGNLFRGRSYCSCSFRNDP